MAVQRMPASFPKTMRALERDSFRSAAWPIAIGLIVIAAWAAWFFGSEVAVVEASSVARIEVVAEPRPVESEVAGRITSTRLVLGQRVQAGDVLVEIDA